jgi:hypothetical protein
MYISNLTDVSCFLASIQYNKDIFYQYILNKTPQTPLKVN